MEGWVKINQLSDLQENIKARDNTILVFEVKDNDYRSKYINYRVWITYSSNKYNLIISYNDYNKWGQLVPGERLPLVKKTTKDDEIEYITTVMKRLWFKDIKNNIISNDFDITSEQFDSKVDFWEENGKEKIKVYTYTLDTEYGVDEDSDFDKDEDTCDEFTVQWIAKMIGFEYEDFSNFIEEWDEIIKVNPYSVTIYSKKKLKKDTLSWYKSSIENEYSYEDCEWSW